MLERGRDPSKMLPLSQSALYIMLSLVEGERHGYGITQEVLRITNGAVRLGSGTLYRQLHQMAVDGWISETVGVPDDSLGRRFYKLTAWGRRIAQAEVTRLQTLIDAARARNLAPSIA